MTDTIKLKELISKSGLKMKSIALRMGITYYSLLKKINNTTEFKAGEIASLSHILGIESLELKEEIFFTLDSDYKSTER